MISDEDLFRYCAKNLWKKRGRELRELGFNRAILLEYLRFFATLTPIDESFSPVERANFLRKTVFGGMMNYLRKPNRIEYKRIVFRGTLYDLDAARGWIVGYGLYGKKYDSLDVDDLDGLTIEELRAAVKRLKTNWLYPPQLVYRLYVKTGEATGVANALGVCRERGRQLVARLITRLAAELRER